MTVPGLFMVFDVESVGLHGEGFAVGWAVMDRAGNERIACRICCPVAAAHGSPDGRKWVGENCPPIVASHITDGSPRELRSRFWRSWQTWKSQGAILVADCGWPVEARFLAACVDDDSSRTWEGPYPFHELASIRLAAGLDPLGTSERLSNEVPIHDPLADARQSARLLKEALSRLTGGSL